MNFTVFSTVLSGVVIFVLGQLIVKLLLDPVQDMKKTIGQISHTLVESAHVISNPGVPTKEIMDETSSSLRKLSSQLHAHLYIIPWYGVTAKVFQLPSKTKLLAASSALIGLSNGVYKGNGKVYEFNAKKVEKVCDSLGIYIAEDSRWPKDLN
jgi:hypothetical protein